MVLLLHKSSNVQRKKRKYRSPLVVTLAMSAGAACSGLAGDGSQGDSSTGGGGGSGSQGAGASNMGGGGASSAERTCTAEELAFPSKGCTPGDECLLHMDCTSGLSRTMQAICADHGWWTVEGACSNPFEQCTTSSGRADCFDGTWQFQGGGGNPPSTCPQPAPSLGSHCYPGNSDGEDPSACGYPCSDDSGSWTLVGCFPNQPGNYMTGTWRSDDACTMGGAGGAGPGGAAGAPQ